MAGGGFIYNTGLVNSAFGGMLIVDSATLISLAKANQLDLLLQAGRQVVLTETLRAEATSNTNFPEANIINSWIESHPNQVVTDYNPNYEVVPVV